LILALTSCYRGITSRSANAIAHQSPCSVATASRFQPVLCAFSVKGSSVYWQALSVGNVKLNEANALTRQKQVESKIRFYLFQLAAIDASQNAITS
jgi:hypothetical protein